MNWPVLMAFGFGQLRLAPDAFWSMTPRELTACMSDPANAAPMPRDTLDALVALHPDTAHD